MQTVKFGNTLGDALTQLYFIKSITSCMKIDPYGSFRKTKLIYFHCKQQHGFRIIYKDRSTHDKPIDARKQKRDATLKKKKVHVITESIFNRLLMLHIRNTLFTTNNNFYVFGNGDGRKLTKFNHQEQGRGMNLPHLGETEVCFAITKKFQLIDWIN